MSMRWPKPKDAVEHTDEDGKTYFTVDMTPHPSVINHYVDAEAREFKPEFVDQCVRIYFLHVVCGIPIDEARKLAEGTHTLHIDEDSDDEAYILRLIGDEIHEEE